MLFVSFLGDGTPIDIRRARRAIAYARRLVFFLLAVASSLVLVQIHQILGFFHNVRYDETTGIALTIRLSNINSYNIQYGQIIDSLLEDSQVHSLELQIC